MMKEKKWINQGGINGSGKGIINTNSQEFLVLQQKIKEASEKRSANEKVEDILLGIRFQMETYLRNPSNKTIIPASQFVKACIRALGITNKAFASYISYKESNLSAICNGKRNITAELALKFSRVFHISAELWLRVQNKEELLKIKAVKTRQFEEMNLHDLLRKTA